MTKPVEHLLSLLRSSLWGAPFDLRGQVWTHAQYLPVMQLAKQQAVAGLVAQALMASGVKLERQDALEVYTLTRNIRQRNEQMDDAVVQLCQLLEGQGIRFLVFKGQTLSALYPDGGLRQSGDIDFICHPDDWSRAAAFFCQKWGVTLDDSTTEKDVQFQYEGVVYELHKKLTVFTYPSHQRYWDEVVMPEIWSNPYSLTIKGQDVPTLSPTYNILYVFVHIFHHLISDGIGLRQFCDWAILLTSCVGWPHDKKLNGFAPTLLQKHLEGIGLTRAYTGLGAILTLYLQVPSFVLKVTDDDCRRAPSLFQNMLEMGNFGHNKSYSQERGVLHGVQHLRRITLQARRFYHYAPAEALWHVPYMFRWWCKKLWKLISRR
ncbi:MAG: nucleotidyltransferase family protein [Bacteroidaceae bacterium]|nr:nucleotidyltransferase family protein [Bacteroidaceae bacterium]